MLIASAPELDDRDGVAVGRGLGDHVGAERAAGAAAVVDHDLLLEDFLQLLPDHAGDQVVRPAGRERHDQPDRLRRKLLRGGRDRTQHNGADADETQHGLDH